MPETRLDFRYTRPDVLSAQRTRFLRSNQLKAILILGLIAMLVLIAPLLLPRVFPPGPGSSWAMVLQVAIAYVVTLLIITFVTPWMDFYVNRFWRLPLTLNFNEKDLRLFVTGKTGGLHFQWDQVRRVEENERVFLIDYGEGSRYIILPKAAFSPAEAQRFRDLLARRAQV